jgi:hypothetical protein
MLKCKYCGSLHSKLAKAHIIPRSFYKQIRGDEKCSLEVTVKEDYEKEKQWQSGMHDSGIVCLDCEKVFNSFDTHGYQTLTNTLRKQKQVFLSDGTSYAYQIEKFDYDKLKLFFLSMLWRASASSLHFFSHINLGPHEPVLRSYISQGIAPEPEQYDVVIFYQQRQFPGILPPWMHKASGVNICTFYLPNMITLIKVDKRPMPELLNQITLQKESPYNLLFLPYSNSSERRYIEEISNIYRKNAAK